MSLLLLSSLVLATSLSSSAFALPTRPSVRRGPSNNTTATAAVDFAADPSIDVRAIYEAAKAAKSKSLAEYHRTAEEDTMIPIYGDWLNLLDTPVIHFIGDMDTDCDGVDYQCVVSTRSVSSWGKLSALRVPYYVIPMEFQDPEPKPNALGAIICNGKMYYAIFGDQNGSQPQVIGEASLMLAQTCFPEDNLTGNKGHVEVDVAYIVFTEQVPDGVGDVEIDIKALKELGDKNVRKLETALQRGGVDSSPSPEWENEGEPTAD